MKKVLLILLSFLYVSKVALAEEIGKTKFDSVEKQMDKYKNDALINMLFPKELIIIVCIMMISKTEILDIINV